MYDGRNKKLELSFNKTSLPVFVKSLNTYNAPESGIGALEREISNYYGNTFSIKNNSEFKMKIISTNTTAFKKENEHNVNTRVYSLNSDYRSTINSYSEIDIQNWNLESRINNDISNYKKIIPCGIKDKDVTTLKKIDNQNYNKLPEEIIKNLITNLKI